MKHKIKKAFNTLLFVIIYIVVLAICVSFAIYGWTTLQDAQTSKRWPSVQGQIINSYVRTDSDEDGVTYFPTVNFKYVVNDHLYTSDTVDFGQYGSSSKRRAQKIVDRYEREKDVVVYYDPDQPLTGVLEPGITGGALFIFGLGLCFTSVLGIGIPYVVFKGRYADS